MYSTLAPLLIFISLGRVSHANVQCRNTPGNPGFPTSAQWTALNASISGKLVNAVPTVEFCKSLPAGNCTNEQFTSALFRNEIPGSMLQFNWEQDYDSKPPSLCILESKVCGQGNVPLFAVLAETAIDIQQGVKFAKAHNLRLAIKASGHDYLGRSTAKNSLLISTHKLQSIEYTNNFVVGKRSFGPALTVGSGVSTQNMYRSNKAHGRFAHGTGAATPAIAGGYVQGAGHSPMSPMLGLAADNCLELEVVLANGDLVKVNEAENSDLFWAIRGGGAGSWGVIVSATFRTFPTLNAVLSTMVITSNNTNTLAKVANVHAKHIFEWDKFQVGQYFYLTLTGIGGLGQPNVPTIFTQTYIPNVDTTQAAEILKTFVDDVQAIPGVSVQQQFASGDINDLLTVPDDISPGNIVLGSRFVPSSAYKQPSKIEEAYDKMLKGGVTNILVNFVAGGKVSETAGLSSAVTPAWRTAKALVILANQWSDQATIPEVHANQTLFMRKQLSILESIAGPNSGTYSNEADSLEENFESTFFGPNYAKLSKIKEKYDPTDLFIVRAGVGSERWDADGLCKVTK